MKPMVLSVLALVASGTTAVLASIPNEPGADAGPPFVAALPKVATAATHGMTTPAATAPAPVDLPLRDADALAQWVSDSLMCRHDPVLQMQNAAFIAGLQALGASGDFDTDAPPVASFNLPHPVDVGGLAVRRIHFYADSGSEFRADTEAAPAKVAHQLQLTDSPVSLRDMASNEQRIRVVTPGTDAGIPARWMFVAPARRDEHAEFGCRSSDDG